MLCGSAASGGREQVSVADSVASGEREREGHVARKDLIPFMSDVFLHAEVRLVP